MPLLDENRRAELSRSFWFTGLVPQATGNDPNIVARIIKMAEATPESVAMTFDGTTYSYAALIAMARGYRDQLIERNARPGAVVALCGDVCPEFISAMLGIWWAGSIAFPLDSTAPALRRRELLTIADASLVISPENSPGGMTGLAGAT